MINPGNIPQFTGDLGQVESDSSGLTTDASNIRTTGSDIHSAFQGLAAFYSAPEAEQLFATTKPVADTADTFAGDLEKVGGALSDYANEVRPIAARLRQLQIDATSFVNSVSGDDDWKYDGDKVAHNNDLLRQVDAAVAAFWAAERTAANRIDALFGGTHYVGNDGSNKSNMYGFTADQMDHAKLPWGSSETEKHHWYEIGHWIKSFVWDGLIVDGVWGTIKGIVTLINPFDWDSFSQAWTGLGELVVGVAVLASPTLRNDPSLPGWMQKSKQVAVNFGKSLVAWDEWSKDPARAAGAVTFNVLTCVVAPLKAGKLGEIGEAGEAGEAVSKVSAATKVLNTLGKTGELIDPMAYLGKIGSTLPSVADIAHGLDHLFTSDIHGIDDLTKVHGVELPDGSVKLPDGSVLHPNGELHLPDGSVKVLDPHELATVGAGHDLPGHDPSGGHDLPGHDPTGHDPAAGGSGHDPTDPNAGGDHTDPTDPRGDQPPPDSGPGAGDGHDGGSPPHDGGAPPDEPAGNLPDGSWEGENGLHLTPEQNAAAEHFVHQAASNEPHVTESMQSVAGHTDGGKLVGLDAARKGEDSLKRKLATELLNEPGLTPEEALADIKDSVRYTLELPTDSYTQGVEHAVHDMQARGFEDVTFKNTWDSAGYKGINSTWRDPSTGQVFELQFHTADSFEAKTVTHDLYEKERLPGVSDEEKQLLQERQDEIFGQVEVPPGAGSIRLG